MDYVATPKRDYLSEYRKIMAKNEVEKEYNNDTDNPMIMSRAVPIDSNFAGEPLL